MKILLMINFILFGSSSLYAGGDHVENGGDSFSIEFVLAAKSLLDNMKFQKGSLLSYQEFKHAIDIVTVTSEDHLFLEGREVDAINSPTHKTIRLNRDRWKVLRDRNDKRHIYILVLHEYLGVMGFDDSSYRYSTALVNHTLKVDRAPFQKPVNFVKFIYKTPSGNCPIYDFWVSEKQKTLKQFNCLGEELSVEFEQIQKEGDLSSTYQVVLRDLNNKELSDIQYKNTEGCVSTSANQCSLSGWISTKRFEFSLYNIKD